jgi:hypothetical protein
LAIHTQQISSKLGQLERSAGNNFFLDNFHLDLDKDQNEISATVANIGMALCQESLSIIFDWSSSLMSQVVSRSSSLKKSSLKTSSTKWSLRSQSIQIDFALANNLSCQVLIESSKSKG